MEEHHDRFELLSAALDAPGSQWPKTAVPRDVHDALLAQTSALVRSRANRKRLGRAAAIGLAYAAGLATMLAAQLSLAPSLAPKRKIAVTPERTVRSPSKTQGAREELASLSPAELRRLVPDAAPQEQIRLLQLAGDRYLYVAADVASALDCYRQVLELTPREKLSRPAPQDSWLFAELKLSALE